MTRSDSKAEAQPEAPSDMAARVRKWAVVIVTGIMAVDLAFIVMNGQWQSAFLIVTIMTVIVAPIVLRDRLPVVIPAEFHLLALVFIFSALFLGEMRSYYDRFWWWDIALHTSSGLLLGIFGFLLVYVLNENRNVDLHMRPRFVALFAFLFAVAVGALWEILEYTMDATFGTRMQKPMLGDDSGLTDTMWDLIVDSVGALAISLLGWWYMHRGAESFIDEWIEKFFADNPRLFRS